MVSHAHCLLTLLIFFLFSDIHYIAGYISNTTFQYVSVAFFYISVIWFGITWSMWLYALYGAIKMDNWRRLNYNEFKSLALLFGISIYVFGLFILASVFYTGTDDVNNENDVENFLIYTAVVLIIHALVVTILPGRASRRMVEREREMLSIKREFVKSISTEVTSPLFVSHASLEHLKSQLKSDPTLSLQKIETQVDSIYYANETALSIMNDLLQYENIDTGTFKLNQRNISLKNIFKGRFKPLQYLAQKYQLELIIFDEIGTSEFYKDPNANQENLFKAIALIIDSSYYSLDVDIISIDQMFRNIMYTMVKNIPAGGTITIRFSIDTNNKDHITNSTQLQIDFSYISALDHDPSVKEFQVVIFNPNKPINETGETGMDLWIAKKIAHAHRGDIHFSCDANGRNSKFSLFLPIINNIPDEELRINISDSIQYHESNQLLRDSPNFPKPFSNSVREGSPRKVYLDTSEEVELKSVNKSLISSVEEDQLFDIEEPAQFLMNILSQDCSTVPEYDINDASNLLVHNSPPLDVEGSVSTRSSKVHSKQHSLFPLHKIPKKVRITNNIQHNEFSFISYITSGSCSDIFKAIYKNHPVVVKMLKEEFESNEFACNEMSLEIEILVRCSHKNIINVYGCGTFPRPFVVLEYLEGGTLANHLNKRRRNRSNRDFHRNIVDNALSIAKTMRYLHSEIFQGLTIIHRDLKPENIGFTSDGTIKIFDFGLASAVLNKNNSSDVYQLTGFTGSIRYMAPEGI